MPSRPSLRELAKMIDHSLLHPTTTDEDIARGCALAVKYNVATACIKPYAIPMVKALLAGSDVAVCPVIAFPHGNSATAIKVAEAEAEALAGGTEIDMVVNIGKVLGGDWAYVSDEIDAVNQTVVANGAILKVIFENDYLQQAARTPLTPCRRQASGRVRYQALACRSASSQRAGEMLCPPAPSRNSRFNPCPMPSKASARPMHPQAR